MLFRRKFKKGHKRPHFVVLFFLLIFLLVAIDHQIRPTLLNISANLARNISTTALNEAVVSAQNGQNINATDFLNIQRDTDNNITSVVANSTMVNQVTAELTLQVEKIISSDTSRVANIPLGTVTGLNLLTGVGPNINVKLKFSNAVTSNLVDTFTDAGINQTDLKIMLQLTTFVYVILPGYSSTQKITDSFLIAESIIVGKVPTQYTQVIGSTDSSTVRNIEDFGSGAAQSQLTASGSTPVAAVPPSTKK